MKPVAAAVGSQQTLVLESQPAYPGCVSPNGAGTAFGKVDIIRIEPSWMRPDVTAFTATSVEMLRVNRPSAVTGHPQQACRDCSVLKT
jgi:hypothetical protein